MKNISLCIGSVSALILCSCDVKTFLNRLHPTTKFRAVGQKNINIYDVTVSLTDCKTEADLQVKLSDSHTYLNSPLYHSFSFKKSILHSQTLQLNIFFFPLEQFREVGDRQWL